MSGNSYQKNGGGGVGVYHEVPDGASRGSKAKKFIGALVIVAIAVGAYFVFHKPAGASVKEAIQKAELPVKSNGKLKLFDKQSTYLCLLISNLMIQRDSFGNN